MQTEPALHPRPALCALVIVLAIAGVFAGAAEHAKDHHQRARELFGDAPLPDIDLATETADASARERELRHRRSRSRSIAAQMTVGRREWKETETRLDRELQEVVAQAQADQRVRQWSRAFDVVRVLAGVAENVYKAAKPPTTQGPGAASSAPGMEPDVPPGRGSSSVPAVETKEIFIFTCSSPASCNELRVREAIRGLGGVSDKSTDSGLNDLLQQVDGMGSMGCGGEFGLGCVPLTDEFALAYSRETRRMAPVVPPGTQPAATAAASDRWTNAVYGALDYLAEHGPRIAREAASVAVDTTLGAAQVKSAIEAATGRDPISGAHVPFPVAIAGFIAANVPLGKVFVRVGRAWRKGAGALSTQRGKLSGAANRVTTYRPKRGRVVVRRGDTKVLDVTNRYTHYTTVSGAEGILNRGVIAARSRGRVYAVRSDEGVLSRVDARGVGARDGRGVVQFNLSGAQEATVTRRWREEAGLWEYVIPGDVELTRGASVLIRN